MNYPDKTLFQKWCEENKRPPLPAQHRQQENPYLQVLKLSEHRAATFEQRESRRVRTWYANHPECQKVLLPLDWRDAQLRGESLIEPELRHGKGWFDKATSVQVTSGTGLIEIIDSHRPEHRLEQVESYENALLEAAAMNTEAYKRLVPGRQRLKLSNEQIQELANRRKNGEHVRNLLADYQISHFAYYSYLRLAEALQG